MTALSKTSNWLRDSDYSLLEGILDANELLQRMPEGSAKFDQAALVNACDAIGLKAQSSSSESVRHRWIITSHNVVELNPLPLKLEHAGCFPYIGRESKSQPKWLWDSHSDATVEATEERLQTGYMAVSYTWGRWENGSCQMAGTPWSVPTTDCDFKIKHLKHILTGLKQHRFFWVDVLCINQDDAKEKREEIAKQGAIFGSATGVLIYLWTIPSSTELAHAVCDLGDCLLRWLRICSLENCEQALHPEDDCQGRPSMCDNVLRDDHWFSSLWTLQEMILAPASVWLARDGGFCRLNGNMITTHRIASAIFLLSKLPPMRTRLLDRMCRDYKMPQEVAWIQRVRESDADGLVKLKMWAQWGLQHASVGACLSASRASILLAGSKREARCNRGIAILAALKVGYSEDFEDGSGPEAGGIPIGLTGTIMRAEGASIFACLHGREPFTSMLPTTADMTHFVNPVDFVAFPCRSNKGDWQLLPDGSILIPAANVMHKMRSGKSVLYMNGGPSLRVDAKRAKVAVREYLDQRRIKVKFVPIAVRRDGTFIAPPFAHMLLENVQGIVIVATDLKAPENSMQVRWHKVAMYNACDLHTYKLKRQIVVRGI